MKRIRLFFILTLILLCISCSQKKFIPLGIDNTAIEKTALIVVPVQLDLVYHNTKKLSITPPFRPSVKYRLRAGKQLLGFQYQEIHINEDSNEEVITSAVVYIQFMAKKGAKYTVEYDIPNNFESAKKIEDIFSIRLKQDNQLVATSSNSLEDLKVIAFSDLSERSTRPSASSLLELKHWWEKSTDVEKEKFIEWSKTH